MKKSEKITIIVVLILAVVFLAIAIYAKVTDDDNSKGKTIVISEQFDYTYFLDDAYVEGEITNLSDKELDNITLIITTEEKVSVTSTEEKVTISITKLNPGEKYKIREACTTNFTMPEVKTVHFSFYENNINHSEIDISNYEIYQTNQEAFIALLVTSMILFFSAFIGIAAIFVRVKHPEIADKLRRKASK